MIKKIYGIVSVFFILIAIAVFFNIDRTNNIVVSIIVQGLLILYLFRVAWGCTLYIKGQYQKAKYSYAIVMNLGLLIFIVINIFRQINLLIVNLNSITINDIYNNTLNSFSYFAYLFLPLMIVFAICSVVSNIVLIKREGLKIYNILGIVFGIIVVAGAYASQVVYEFTTRLQYTYMQTYIKKFIDIGLNAVLCYFYCLTVATLYCNIMAANHKPKFGKDFVIILGSRIRDDGTLTPILKGRVDKAIKFAKDQKDKTGKDIVYIPSGGKGDDEIMPEARAMKNYLVEKGINKNKVLVESQSRNTVQNFIFTKRIIDEKNENGKIVFVTTNYHVFRSGVIANYEGIDCEGIGSTTKWYFYVNALLREFVANLFVQRKQHLILITSINVIIFILVFVGYKYNLI